MPTIQRSVSDGSLNSVDSTPSYIGSVITAMPSLTRIRKRDRIRRKAKLKREVKQQNREWFGSLMVAIAVFFIFAWAIRSCNNQRHSLSLRRSSSTTTDKHDMPSQNHRRLAHMEFAHKNAPSDLKIMNKMNNKKNNDPRTTSKRNSTPLDEYKLNPLIKPDGYP